MKTKAFLQIIRRPALLVACASLVGFSISATAVATEPTYDNYIDVSVGVPSVSNDKAAFQRNAQTNAGGSGGIEDLYYYKDLSDTISMTLKGRALSGDNDFLFDLTINKEDVNYFKIGYKEYRVWFDGSAGFYPPTSTSFNLYNEAMHVDRGNFWIEAGHTPEDGLNAIFRYDFFTRQGKKDSTAWGDTSFGRYIVPTFHNIDEKRHQVAATLSQKRESDNWELGLRMDKGEYTNSRNISKRPGDAGQDRKLTHKEGRDTDLFQIRGLYVNRLNERVMLTSAVAQTKIETSLNDSRIFGPDFDSTFDLLSPNRQYRDHGFSGLIGETNMTQTVGTISAMYQPNEHWTVVPSIKVEDISGDSMAVYQGTDVSSSRVTSIHEANSVSDRSWRNISESINVRYKGYENVVLNFKAEWYQIEGDLKEQELDHGVVQLDRLSKTDRKTHKYSVTTNWYPAAGTTVAVQFYNKGRDNKYNSSVDDTNTSYPAYLTEQEFETNDFNARFSWRVNPKLRTVTRYDYQESTISTQGEGLGTVESSKMTSHILSETLSIQPRDDWYLQAMVNYVWDQMTTLAAGQTGSAEDLVLNSDNNYLNFSISSGFVLDEGSDLYVDYSLYRAFNDFTDNWDKSVAYGTDARRYQVGMTWIKKLNSRTSFTMRYAYAKGEDSVFGGLDDYKAQMVYAKVQHRF